MGENDLPRTEKSPISNKFSEYFYNNITYVGIFLAVFVFIVECFLFGFDFIAGKDSNVYLGMFTYIILPHFLLLGLILIPFGALRKRRRILKGLAERKHKTFFIDPAIPTHRNAIFVFMISSMVLLIMTAIGSYKAFHFTESVHFCGITCHQVMRPQYTAYRNSPHARVKCVDCHIGSGADWYVRSKLSGARQVVATIVDSYSRPIPTPVHNLRPAKETCEQCHWPKKFYRSFELEKHYFPSDKGEHKSWFIRMLVNVGGGEKENRGIHAHMNINNDFYYVADDERRQVISWVKSVDQDGKAVIYTSPDSEYKETEPPEEKIRKMDCMDCHNRPTHHFGAPYQLINRALLAEDINPDIPSIKKKAMAALSAEYSSTEEGVKLIRENLTTYYQEKHAAFYSEHKQDIEKALDNIIDIFQNNVFPEMKARWDAYPDNIGHLISPGCFRCHDGEHTSKSGKVITRDCNACHRIIEQGPPEARETNTEGLPFVHPFEDDGLWQEMQCSDCHTGN